MKCWTVSGLSLVGQAGSVYLAKRVARAPYLRDELALHGGSTKTERNFIDHERHENLGNRTNVQLFFCTRRLLCVDQADEFPSF